MRGMDGGTDDEDDGYDEYGESLNNNYSSDSEAAKTVLNLDIMKKKNSTLALSIQTLVVQMMTDSHMISLLRNELFKTGMGPPSGIAPVPVSNPYETKIEIQKNVDFTELKASVKEFSLFDEGNGLTSKRQCSGVPFKRLDS